MLPVCVSGDVLPAASPAHHQADLLLQPCGQSLGCWLRSLPLTRLRYSHQKSARLMCLSLNSVQFIFSLPVGELLSFADVEDAVVSMVGKRMFTTQLPVSSLPGF